MIATAAVSHCRRRLGLLAAALAASLLVTGLSWLGLAAAQAQSLVADLSSHLIAITTGFTGTEVVLFGATDGPGEVAVVVLGPPGQVTVRRKERIAGLWVNRHPVTFSQVPSYYAVASSRPLATLAPPSVLARHQLGVESLPLSTLGTPLPTETLPPEMLAAYRQALIQDQQRQGLYAVTSAPVVFLGQRLFRTTLRFPAAVATGTYTISVFLLRDHDVISAETTPLLVSKTGLSAEISEFAQRQPALYGLAALAGALAIGWVAGSLFGKV